MRLTRQPWSVHKGNLKKFLLDLDKNRISLAIFSQRIEDEFSGVLSPGSIDDIINISVEKFASPSLFEELIHVVDHANSEDDIIMFFNDPLY